MRAQEQALIDPSPSPFDTLSHLLGLALLRVLPRDLASYFSHLDNILSYTATGGGMSAVSAGMWSVRE